MRAEASLAAGLLALLHNGHDRLTSFADVDWERAERWLHGQTGAELAPEQRQAVRLALTHKVAVLTGGPGCGKSFTVRSIVLLARAKRAQRIDVGRFDRAATISCVYGSHRGSMWRPRSRRGRARP